MRRLLSMRFVPVALVVSVLGVQAIALRAAPVPKSVTARPVKDRVALTDVCEIVERPGGYLVVIEVEYEATGARVVTCPVYDENTGEFAPARCGELTAYSVKEGRGRLAFGFFIGAGSKWGASITDGTFAQAWVTPEMRLPTGELKAEAADHLHYSAEGGP